MWHTPVSICDFSWCRWICLVDIFQTIPVISSPELRYVSKSFLHFLNFFSLPSLHKLQGGEIKDKKKKKKIKIPEVHQCSDNDTIDTIGKISMRRIQRHQGSSSIMTGVCPTSRPKENEPRSRVLLVSRVDSGCFFVLLFN